MLVGRRSPSNSRHMNLVEHLLNLSSLPLGHVGVGVSHETRRWDRTSKLWRIIHVSFVASEAHSL